MRLLTTFFLTLLLFIGCCGCSLIKNEGVIIEDINGDDINLAVLTDDDLRDEFPDNYCVSASVKYDGEYSYPQDHIYYETYQDHDVCEMKAISPFSGVGTILVTYGKSDRIEFTVTNELSSGNMRIFLIDLNTLEILHDFPINGTETFLLHNTFQREFEVRIAGESAVTSISVSRTFNE